MKDTVAGLAGLFLKSLLWVVGSSPGLRCLDVCDLDNYCLLFSVTLLIWLEEKTYQNYAYLCNNIMISQEIFFGGNGLMD
jgi:hypothetical protein